MNPVYSTVLENETVSSGGGNSVSDEVEVFDSALMSVKVEGDADSSNFKLEIRGKFDVNGDFGEYHVSSGNDTTGSVNNSKFYTFDVSDLNRVKINFINDAQNSTTVTVKSGATDYE
jgi:hypothetical protein